MTADPDTNHAAPAAWIARYAPLVRRHGRVLDVAAGEGRHSRLFLARGHAVVAIDRDVAGLSAAPGLSIVAADLERPGPWPLGDARFAAIAVVNYLHRPLFPALIAALEADGVLLYETFAVGHERLGRPTNPDFLLAPGELIARLGADLRVIAYEHGIVEAAGRVALKQRILAQGLAAPVPPLKP